MIDSAADARCSQCGTARPDVATSQTRPPCPVCGTTALTFSRSALEVLPPTTDSLTARLIPGDGSRGWRRRWTEVLRELDRLEQPRTGLSGDAIHAAREEFHSFFLQTYHLKDALIAEAAVPGGPDAVETAITASPDLALLADVANLDKHPEFKRRPRSGTVPQFGEPSGVTCPGGWRLSLPIHHGPRQWDGLDFARRAVEAWRDALRGWGLL